ncbi:unnamed protein product [Meloidogyne enterolobii]|uniref:Uncharacterized protein n=1 Tax=Meloidogyne enterolobii TaxID=390850 RepID=A0ACB0ZUG6_MELEN
MVPFIVLDYYYPCGLQLTEKAENVEIEHRANLTSITYEIVNKHNPKVKFSFCSQGWKIGRKVYKTKIRIVKGIRRNLNYVDSSDYKYFVN